MDPDTTLEHLVQAILYQDRAEALEHLQNLAEWLDKGGYNPHWGVFATDTFNLLTNLDRLEEQQQ